MQTLTSARSVAPRILLVDDDQSFCDQMSNYLDENGFDVLSTTNPSQFKVALGTFKPDLVLVDQRLGVTTGTEMLRHLRAQSDTPCIVVSGRPDPTDRVVNLEMGADDDVDKSTPPRELLARVRAVLRRHRKAERMQSAPASKPCWSIDIPGGMLLRPDGAACTLTAHEFRILSLLVEARGAPVPRRELYERTFGQALPPRSKTIDNIIGRLRRKIDGNLPHQCIKSARKVGYAFVGFPGSAAE
jgi:DNA-binding response OmpR family regulator